MSEDVSEQNVSDWVNNERFEGFVHVTKSNFHDIAETGRLFLSFLNLFICLFISTFIL